MEYEEAKRLEEKIQKGNATKTEIAKVLESVTWGLCGEWRSYCKEGSPWNDRDATRRRLVQEGSAAVIATNPPLACGFAADRILLHLLARSSVIREIAEMPEMPGYLYLDAAKMEARMVKGKWW
jgi:hypothetical protein